MTIGDDPMSRALAQIAANGAAERARKVRINTDRRIVARRATLAALPVRDSGPGLFLDMADGTMQRRAIINKLIRARIELLDGFPHHARRILRDVAVVRKQYYVATIGTEQNVVSLRLVAGGAAPLAKVA